MIHVHAWKYLIILASSLPMKTKNWFSTGVGNGLRINIDLSSVKSSNIHQRTILHKKPQLSVTKISLIDTWQCFQLKYYFLQIVTELRCVSRNSCTSVLDVVKKLAVAMENGEYDFDGTKEKKVRQDVVCSGLFLTILFERFYWFGLFILQLFRSWFKGLRWKLWYHQWQNVGDIIVWL